VTRPHETHAPTRRDVERMLRAIELRGAPAALRAGVIDAARAVSRTPATRADRIWFSRPWRLGFAVALVVLALVEWAAVRRLGADGVPGGLAEHEGAAVAAELGLPGRITIGARVTSGEPSTIDEALDQ
jgi:hypothetical protein